MNQVVDLVTVPNGEPQDSNDSDVEDSLPTLNVDDLDYMASKKRKRQVEPQSPAPKKQKKEDENVQETRQKVVDDFVDLTKGHYKHISNYTVNNNQGQHWFSVDFF